MDRFLVGALFGVALNWFARQCWALRDISGQHLNILAMELTGSLMTERNATGHITKMTGFSAMALDYLHQSYHFSYTLLPIYSPLGDDSPTYGKGAIRIAKDGEADLLLGLLRANPERLKSVDFSQPFYYGSFSIAIPFPQAGSAAKRISAIVEPFDVQVWTLVPPTIALVSVSLYVIHKRKHGRRNVFNAIYKSLFSSDGILNRWIVGAWCLFTFFLVQIYSSTLTSHLTSPLQKPIIQAIEDVPNVAGLKILVQKDHAADAYIEGYPFGVLKYLGDTLRNNKAEQCCEQISQCVSKLLNGGSYVFVDTPPSVLSIIRKDRLTNGICRLTAVKQQFGFQHTFMAVGKTLYLLDYVSMGILRMNENGLTNRWIDEFMVKTPECLNYGEQKKDKTRIQLSMQHLSGAFVLLVAGYTISLIVFMGERIHHVRRK